MSAGRSDVSAQPRPRSGPSWSDACGNPDCQTGWLQTLRRRGAPRFEGNWACSTVCIEQIIARALRTEIENWDFAPPERSLRMPLGLILLSRGWIRQRELQEALAAQRQAGRGRIGDWLRELHGISGETIAKALAVQWNCAVLAEANAGIELAPRAMPALLQRRYDLLVLSRHSDGALFLSGRCRADHAAARALEHIVGSPVTPIFVTDELWRQWEAAVVEPEIEPATGGSPRRDGAAAAIQAQLERARPAGARLVRMHDHLWLRMWQKSPNTDVEDVVLPLRPTPEPSSVLSLS